MFCRHLDGAVVTSQTISHRFTSSEENILSNSATRQDEAGEERWLYVVCVQTREGTVLFEGKIWGVK